MSMTLDGVLETRLRSQTLEALRRWRGWFSHLEAALQAGDQNEVLESLARIHLEQERRDRFSACATLTPVYSFAFLGLLAEFGRVPTWRRRISRALAQQEPISEQVANGIRRAISNWSQVIAELEAGLQAAA